MLSVWYKFGLLWGAPLQGDQKLPWQAQARLGQRRNFSAKCQQQVISCGTASDRPKQCVTAWHCVQCLCLVSGMRGQINHDYNPNTSHFYLWRIFTGLRDHWLWTKNPSARQLQMTAEHKCVCLHWFVPIKRILIYQRIYLSRWCFCVYSILVTWILMPCLQIWTSWWCYWWDLFSQEKERIGETGLCDLFFKCS